jgi:hypothetical protein
MPEGSLRSGTEQVSELYPRVCLQIVFEPAHNLIRLIEEVTGGKVGRLRLLPRFMGRAVVLAVLGLVLTIQSVVVA